MQRIATAGPNVADGSIASIQPHPGYFRLSFNSCRLVRRSETTERANSRHLRCPMFNQVAARLDRACLTAGKHPADDVSCVEEDGFDLLFGDFNEPQSPEQENSFDGQKSVPDLLCITRF